MTDQSVTPAPQFGPGPQQGAAPQQGQGPQPGQFGAPGQPMGQFPMGPDPAAEAARKKKARVINTISVLVLIVMGTFAFFVSRSAPGHAKAGDCVKKDGADSISIVECTDPAAAYTVLGRVDKQMETQFNDSSCDAYPEATAGYWEGKKGSEGYVLCLKKK